MTEAGGNNVAGQTEARVVAAVNVLDELVDLVAVAARSQVDGLLVRRARGEQAAQAEERAAADARARYALVLALALDEQYAHAAADVHHNVWIGVGEIVARLAEGRVAQADVEVVVGGGAVGRRRRRGRVCRHGLVEIVVVAICCVLLSV